MKKKQRKMRKKKDKKKKRKRQMNLKITCQHKNKNQMNLKKLITIGFLTLIPSAAYAQTTTELGEVTTFGELISLIWAYGSNVIIAFAIFFIVLGAFFYITSGGNEERIDEGKEMIFGALIAIAIVVLSGVLIRVLHQPSQGTTDALSEVPKVIGNATNILISLIGAFSFLMLAYAAILYLTGKGEKGKIEKAHRAFRYAIYGLIIGMLSFGITNTIIRFLL